MDDEHSSGNAPVHHSLTDCAPPFDQGDVQIIHQDSPFQGFFRVDKFRLRHRLYQGGWSDEISRELFVRTRAVAVLPYDPVRDEILLVEQFRIGALKWRSSPWCLELIAGIADVEGESLESLARREAREEANLELGVMQQICSYMPSPGGSNERLTVFVAKADLDGAGGIHGKPEEGEDIRVVTLPLQDLDDLLVSGWLDNAATQVAGHWLLRHYQQLRQDWKV